MDVFELRRQVIEDYADYVQSFVTIRDQRIRDKVGQELNQGVLWPEPLLQLNPNFAQGEPLSDLIARGTLHPECAQIFRRKGQNEDGSPRRVHPRRR